MKKVFLLICVMLDFFVLADAKANYLSLEFENLGQKWRPRVGFFLEPIEELLIQFRQNIISEDSGVLVGYNFNFGDKIFTINPNLGINMDTQLRVTYARPELQILLKFTSWSVFCLASAGLPIVDDKNHNLFLLGQVMYSLSKYYLGVKLEMLNDWESLSQSFIQVGPRIGYLFNNFYFGLWSGIQVKTISAFVRVEIKLIF